MPLIVDEMHASVASAARVISLAKCDAKIHPSSCLTAKSKQMSKSAEMIVFQSRFVV